MNLNSVEGNSGLKKLNR